MTFQKVFNFLLAIIFAVNLFSQQKIAEYYLPASLFKGATPSLFCTNGKELLADLHTIEGGVRLSIIDGKDPETYYQYGSGIDSGAPGFISSTKAVNEILTLQWLGGVSQNNVFDDCYLKPHSRKIYFVEMNIAGGGIIVTDTVLFSSDEHIITVLQENGKLYLISYRDNSDIVYLRVKEPLKKMQLFEKIIPVSTGKRDGRKGPHFSDFFKNKNESGLFIFDNTHPYPPNMPENARKIYHFPDKLIFSLENPDQRTNIVNLNLGELTHEFYTIPPPFKLGRFVDTEEDATNSFLTNSILFKTGNYGGYFYITATDIYTGVVHYNYIVKLTDDDTLARTNFFRNCRYTGISEEDRDDLHKYLETPSIAVNYSGGSLFDVEISTLYSKSSWAHVLLSVAGSFAGTYFINSLPRVNGFSLFFFYQQKTFSAKNTLDINTGNFTSEKGGAFSTDKWESNMQKANAFTQKNKAYNPGTLILGETVYVYFIDEDEGKFFVYKF